MSTSKNTFFLPALFLGGVAISFAAGYGTAWYMQTPVYLPVQAAGTTPQPTAIADAQANMGQLGDLWNRTGPARPAADPAPADGTPQVAAVDAEEKLRLQAQTDPAVARNLMHRYERETDKQARAMLKSVLGTVQTPEVLAFAKRLATSSDVTQRSDGLELLQFLSPDSPEVRNIAKQALANEQQPEVILQALGVLQPTAADPAESAAIVGQLQRLTQHADPMVRSQSLLQLSQWDKEGRSLDRLTQGLNDRAPEVREAAVFAIAQSGTRADSAKAMLLQMVADPNESRNIRGSALQALERFSLNKDEYATYHRVRSQLGAM